MLSRIARKFHLPEEKLRSRLTCAAPRSPSPTSRAAQSAAATQRRTTIRIARRRGWPICRRGTATCWNWCCSIRRLIARRGRRRSSRRRFTSPVARRIYAACCRLAEDGWHDDFGRLLAAFDDPDMKNLLVQLDESCRDESHGRPRTLAGRFARNAPPPRRRSRSPRSPRRRPARRRRRRTTARSIL